MNFKNQMRIAFLITFVTCISGCGIGWPIYRAQLEKVTERGAPLIGAITKYEKDKGNPPHSLDQLVPDYIQEIPRPGYHSDRWVRDEFRYTVFPDRFRKLTRVWYDLGSRNGAGIDGLWVYKEGDPDHAILVFQLDKDDRVIGARVDRMPKKYKQIEFDIDKWNKRDSRIAMVRSLPKYRNLDNIAYQELTRNLGMPDGKEVIREATWQLSAYTMIFHELVYRPSMDYPFDSRRYPRIGDWYLIPD